MIMFELQPITRVVLKISSEIIAIVRVLNSMRSQALSGLVNSLSLLNCHTLMTHLCFAQLARHKSLVPTSEKWILRI